MSKPTLGYWGYRGFGTPIRYLLYYKNVDFEDKRYPEHEPSAWEKVKFSLNLDFPNLPYYIDGNVRLTQSTTILRYLAGKHGLDGKTEEEKLRVSLAEQQILDFRESFVRLTHSESFEELRPDFVAKVPSQIKLIANFLGNRKFFAGNSLTYVDFIAYDTIDFYQYLIPNVLSDFPNLRYYQESVQSLPELQTFLKSSAYSRWPIFSPRANWGGKGPEPKQE